MTYESEACRGDWERDVQKDRDVAEYFDDLDERVGDLLGTFASEPNQERLEELEEQLSSACPWLATVRTELLISAIAKVASRRICGAP